MKLVEYEAVLEALLFALGEAVPVSKLAATIGQDVKTTKLLIKELMDKYESGNRGIRIIEIGESYQMCTNAKYFDYIEKLVYMPKKKTLTQPLLETLAIIAYKQPITKTEIEDIRGVNSDHAVNRLIEYNLVVEKGRRDAPGKPIIFGTSQEFLKYLGLSGLDKLPQLEDDLNRLRQEAEQEMSLLEYI